LSSVAPDAMFLFRSLAKASSANYFYKSDQTR
jgi:hypothetical protein